MQPIATNDCFTRCMKYTIKHLVQLTAAACLLALPCAAQPGCKLEHYSTENGLSHDVITYMFKDKDGFMWFATWNGLNRFDGKSFVTFKSSPGDANLIQHNRIDQITEDLYQHLWLKAYDGQVYRFDKKQEQFSPLSAIAPHLPYTGTYKSILSATGKQLWIATTEAGLLQLHTTGADTSGYTLYRQGGATGCTLPSNNITFFTEDQQHNIWVGTSKGLARLTPRNATQYYSRHINLPKDADAPTCYGEVNKALFFGSASGHVICYSKNSNTISTLYQCHSRINALQVSHNQQQLYVTTADGALYITTLQNNHTTCYRQQQPAPLHSIYEDRHGNLWMKPEQDGVVRFNTSNKHFTTYRQHNNAGRNYSGDHFKVFEDRNGLLWVNLKGGGFGYYDASADKIAYYFNDPSSAGRKLSNIVNSLYYDPEGLLWLRTDERGLEKITFHPDNFRQHLPHAPSSWLSDNEVRGMLEDTHERLWVSTKNGNLYIYSPAGQQLTDLFTNMPAGGLGQVYTIMQDRTGAVWLGTKAHGLYKATPVNTAATHYTLAHYTHSAADAASISSNEIYTIAEDEQGRIWIGSFENGLNLAVPGKDGKLRFIHHQHCLGQYPTSRFGKIRHLTSDGKGHLWVATTDGLMVINCTDTARLAYAGYRKIPGDSTSLGSNNVQHIYKDRNGHLWLATAGGGLNRAIGGNPMQQLRFEVLTTRHGLPNDYLLSTTQDAQGNLWVATQAGLTRFNPAQKTFRNYNSGDGLPPYAFSEAAVVSRRNGTLAFGTIKGYITLNPQQLTETPVQAGMALTRLLVNGAAVQPGAADGLLPQALNYCTQLTLPHNRNNLSIHYVALDFRWGNERTYAYRLRGFESNWNTQIADGAATYTNLPPGSYVFEVKLLNAGLYNPAPYRQLQITVQPPLWKTWWAWLLYALFTTAIILLLRRTALTLLRLRQNIALEQKLSAMKQQFFTHVSHELRTPLTLIQGPAEALAQQEALSAKGRQHLDVIRRNATRMNHFVNQLLQLRKLESGNTPLLLSRVHLPALLQHTSAYFTEKAGAKNIHLHLHTAPDSTEVWLDADKMETVLYNLLANALKFTPAGKQITVSARQHTDGTTVLEVADEGCGVPQDKLPQIFNLFYESNTANQSDTAGTGIGLAIAREITALHNGSIQAWNNTSGGLTVQLHLPPLQPPAATSGAVPVHTAPATHAAPPPPEADSTPDENLPLLLLVEDNTELRSFIKSQLTPFYRVATADNGKTGWEKTCLLLPDLVLSDIMMPEMNGIAMLEQIKNNVSTSHIPVILLTARNAVESQIEGMENGADYYIAKPFQPALLLAAIRNQLRQRKILLQQLLTNQPPFTIAPDMPQVTSQDQQFLQKLKQIVEEKMSEENFDIDTAAEAIGMGRTTFYKKIKALTGLAPVEFVREMRLKRAQQYMDAGYGNISEVAYAVGFSNAKYFSTCFKTRFQLTPSEYLKQQAARTQTK